MAANGRSDIFKYVIANINVLTCDGKRNDAGNPYKYVALLLRGVLNPTVTENTFEEASFLLPNLPAPRWHGLKYYDIF